MIQIILTPERAEWEARILRRAAALLTQTIAARSSESGITVLHATRVCLRAMAERLETALEAAEGEEAAALLEERTAAVS